MARIYVARTINEAFCHHGNHVGTARNGRDNDGYVAPSPEILRLQTGKRPVNITPVMAQEIKTPIVSAMSDIIRIRPTVVKRKLLSER